MRVVTTIKEMREIIREKKRSKFPSALCRQWGISMTAISL